MSGWILLTIGLLIAIGDFAVGYRFARMGEPLAPQTDPSAPSREDARRLGRIIMLAAPLFFLVFAALAFGLIPTDGIDPITIGSAR